MWVRAPQTRRGPFSTLRDLLSWRTRRGKVLVQWNQDCVTVSRLRMRMRVNLLPYALHTFVAPHARMRMMKRQYIRRGCGPFTIEIEKLEGFADGRSVQNVQSTRFNFRSLAYPPAFLLTSFTHTYKFNNTVRWGRTEDQSRKTTQSSDVCQFRVHAEYYH